MRPLPDANTWTRLSALFDTGVELPPDLRRSWLQSVADTEPDLIDWLRGMLDHAEPPVTGDALVRGPWLPAWVDEPMGHAAADEAAAAAASPESQGPLLLREPRALGPAHAAHVPHAAVHTPNAPAPRSHSASLAAGPLEDAIAARFAQPLPDGSADSSIDEITDSVADSVLDSVPDMVDVDIPVSFEPADVPEDVRTDVPAAAAGASASASAGAGAGATATPVDVLIDVELDGHAAATPAALPIEIAALAAAIAAAGAAGAEGFAQAATQTHARATAPVQDHSPLAHAPALASGMQVGPWLLLGPLVDDGRLSAWRARRADAPNAPEVLVQVPRQWRVRADLARSMEHAATRPAALMHAHIARFLDAGLAADGTPWIASAFIEGQPIDLWCRDHARQLGERQAIFEQALEAVQFAHSHFVLHGHIHPAQLVVTADGQVCWLNFGLGDLLAVLGTPPGADVPLATGAPARAYAAPEHQHGEPPSIAGDMHALGVILFDVLTGMQPWQPSASGEVPKAAGIEGQRWPRPSELAEAKPLRRALRGALDAIVGKALHTDPAKRYASAADLLDDLRRHRVHQPVRAMRGGIGYAIACMVRRHRVASGVAAALGVVLACGLGLVLVKGWRPVGERPQAVASARGGDAANALLQELLLDTAQAGVVPELPALLARGEEVARSSLKEQPASLGQALGRLGRLQAERGALPEGRKLLAEALPLVTDPAESHEIACDEAWVQGLQADNVRAAEQRLHRIADDTKVHALTRARCLARLADLAERAGNLREAYDLAYTAWERWDKSGERIPQVALGLSRPMGPFAAKLGRFQESQQWFEYTMKLAAQLKRENSPMGIELREQWGEVSLAAGDATRSVELADANLAALSPEPRAVRAPAPAADAAAAPPAALFFAAAEPRIELGLIDEARERLGRAITLADARQDGPMRQRARCLMALAALRERDAAAAARWLKSLPDLPTSNTSEARAADQLCRLSADELALQQGKAAEALRDAERVLAGTDLAPRMRAAFSLLRAEAALAAKQTERALTAALEALQQARTLHQFDAQSQKAKPSFRSGQAALALAEAHRANGDYDAAGKTLAYAVQQLEGTLPEKHPSRVRAAATAAALTAAAPTK